MALVLMWITIGVLALIIGILAFYLVSIALFLTRANRNLAQLADGLEAIQANSRPLPDRLPAINSALAELLRGLRSVDAHMAGIERILKP